ncbi:DeoR/GlpR family DNA-binding transcription regulator [Lagierella sp.]|uniref:DeoR/GlpR family DNA-binding transcription regulator n=1 Tax=Lagierella sp. TaxID=2849657 RepID=UPI002629C4EA|nr:DeoR/GlpR family DNA-binding transcription regulator [Lagierella sp.]
MIAQRHKCILRELEIKSPIKVEELSEKLKVSVSTIRRDLNTLDRQGALIKVHGGAIRIEDQITEDVERAIRKELNVAQKEVIAKKASTMIRPGDVVYLDAGSTVSSMVKYDIPKDVTFVTNDLITGVELSLRGYRVHVPAGNIKASTGALIGEECISSLSKFVFDIGFFGANGISEEKGFTTPDISEGEVKKKALERCKKKFILADKSKVNKVCTYMFCEYDRDILITEN